MTTSNQAVTLQQRAEQLTEALFTNGAGQRADRLVLTDDHEGRDLGGWAWTPVADRIEAALRAVQAEERARCAEAVRDCYLAENALEAIEQGADHA